MKVTVKQYDACPEPGFQYIENSLGCPNVVAHDQSGPTLTSRLRDALDVTQQSTLSDLQPMSLPVHDFAVALVRRIGGDHRHVREDTADQFLQKIRQSR